MRAEQQESFFGIRTAEALPVGLQVKAFLPAAVTGSSSSSICCQSRFAWAGVLPSQSAKARGVAGP